MRTNETDYNCLIFDKKQADDWCRFEYLPGERRVLVDKAFDPRLSLKNIDTLIEWLGRVRAEMWKRGA